MARTQIHGNPQSDISAPAGISVPAPAARPHYPQTPAPDRENVRRHDAPSGSHAAPLRPIQRGLHAGAQGFRLSRKRRSRIEIRSHTQSAPACSGRPRIAQRKDRPVRRTLPQRSQTGRSPAENMENRRTQESDWKLIPGRMRRGRREPAQISRKTTVAAGRIRRLSCRCNAILPQGDIHVPDL